MGSTKVLCLKALSLKASTARDLMTRQTMKKTLNHGALSTMRLLIISRLKKKDRVGGGISSGYHGP